MNITVSTIISSVKRHLAAIGKRLNKDGRGTFSDITLSSAEDTPLLTQYVNSSAQNIEAALKMFISASTYGSTISMTIANTRGDDDFETRTKDMAESYITMNTIGEYLSMTHPDLARKYQEDATQRMDALVGYVFYKKPVTASAYSYSQVTGGIVEEQE